MGLTVIQSKTYKAKNEYVDDGSEYIEEWIGGGCYVGRRNGKERRITFAEGRVLVKYRKDKRHLRRIYKGDLYERQFNNMDGDVFTFRMKKDLFDICCKYDLFPEY